MKSTVDLKASAVLFSFRQMYIYPKSQFNKVFLHTILSPSNKPDFYLKFILFSRPDFS